MFKKLKKIAVSLALPFALASGVQSALAAPDSATRKIGDVLQDGSVYAGVSPLTNAPMFTTPKDTYRADWYDAVKHCGDLDAYGHKDWRMPSETELLTLFNNRAAIGNFDTSSLSGHYWSSAPVGDAYGSWGRQFNDGKRRYGYSGFDDMSVRCVR